MLRFMVTFLKTVLQTMPKAPLVAPGQMSGPKQDLYDESKIFIC